MRPVIARAALVGVLAAFVAVAFAVARARDPFDAFNPPIDAGLDVPELPGWVLSPADQVRPSDVTLDVPDEVDPAHAPILFVEAWGTFGRSRDTLLLVYADGLVFAAHAGDAGEPIRERARIAPAEAARLVGKILTPAFARYPLRLILVYGHDLPNATISARTPAGTWKSVYVEGIPPSGDLEELYETLDFSAAAMATLRDAAPQATPRVRIDAFVAAYRAVLDYRPPNAERVDTAQWGEFPDQDALYRLRECAFVTRADRTLGPSVHRCGPDDALPRLAPTDIPRLPGDAG
jgi:hypothetical protein